MKHHWKNIIKNHATSWMAEEYLVVKPEEFQQLVQYYKGQIVPY